MSEVYVLVKQVPGRPNGEVTLHGVTEDEGIADTWGAAHEECWSVWMDTEETPSVEPAQWEEEVDH